MEEEEIARPPAEQASVSVGIWLVALGVILLGLVLYMLRRKRVATH